MEKMGILHDAKDGVARQGMKQEALAEKTGVSQSAISRLLKGQGSMRADNLAKILDFMGAKLTFPDERSELAKDVRWVDAKIVPAGSGQNLPPQEDYFAVPLVGEVGAGPGVMSTDLIRSWVLVYRHQHAIQFRRNLLAVEIEKGSTSMIPLLRPGDIVLVNRDDFTPDKPGGIFLVREPGQDSGAMVKRVATKQRNGDTLVTFYSDNAAENPPTSYSLGADYGGVISNAIVGRCIWSWSDLSGK